MNSDKKKRNFILSGIAGSLNAVGSALVFSYDSCAGGVGSVINLFGKNVDTGSRQDYNEQLPEEQITTRRIRMNVKKYGKILENLNQKLAKMLATADDQDTFLKSKQARKLLTDIKDIEEKISALKKQLVKFKLNKKSKAMLKEEFKAYKKRNTALSSKHRKQYKSVIEAIKKTIHDRLVLGVFADDSERRMFKVVATDIMDHDINIQTFAVQKIVEINDEEALPVLLEALAFDEPELQVNIIASLTVIGDKAVLPHFTELLNDPYYVIRKAALIGISEIAEKHDAVEFQLSALKDSHPEVRVAAVKTFDLQNNMSALDVVADSMNDKDETVRKAVIAVLAETKSSDALPALIQGLSDKVVKLRENSLEAIRSIYGKELYFDVQLTGSSLNSAIDDLKTQFINDPSEDSTVVSPLETGTAGEQSDVTSSTDTSDQELETTAEEADFSQAEKKKVNQI